MEKKIEIIPYTKSHLNEWEDIVNNSNNGTIYNTQHFMAYHPKDRFKNFHHLISLNGKTVCVIPGSIVKKEIGKTFVSYSGTSFGGFILLEHIGLNETDLIISTFLKYLEDKKFKRIEITLAPIFFSRSQNNHIDFILSKDGFGFKKREITSVITLNYLEENVLDTFKPTCKRSIKKAISEGLEVHNDDSLKAYKEYYKLLTCNLSLRHNVSPAHTLEEMVDIKKRFPDNVFLFGAYYQNKMVGGVWLIKANRDVSVAFYISHDPKYQHLRPVNLLYYEMIKRSLFWNQRYFDLGLFTVNMKPNYGLGRFKENFGAQGIFRDYFEKNL